MNKAYLLIGGNKGDKHHNLKEAIKLIAEKAGSIISTSSIYKTAAWGNENQPDFFNQVLLIETKLSAENLLKTILSIEESLGRIRTEEKWMERTIDIDILFYNNEVIHTNNLKIPHPHLQDRKFVLVPLAQIAPQLNHPTINKNILELLKTCTDKLEVTQVSSLAFDSISSKG